ncbi:MAG: MFS transporter [Candidatus Dormibacteria bacterium]
MNSGRPRPLYREKSFVFLWAAQTTSLAGSGITAVVLPVLVYDRSGSAALTALLTALEVLPYLAFGLVAGAMADRADRKRVMVGCDLVAAVLLGSIPAVQAGFGSLSVLQLLLVALGAATAFVWSDAASFGAVPALVGKARIALAMSRIWSSEAVVGLLAPAAAGGLLALISPANAIVVDSLSYLISAGLIASIREPFQTSSPAERVTQWRTTLTRDIREGLAFLWGHRVLRSMTLASAATAATGGAIEGLLVVYSVKALGFAKVDSRIGLLFSAAALGGLVASLLLPQIQKRIGPGLTVVIFLFLNAVTLVVFALAPNLLVALPALATYDFAYAMITLGVVTFRQSATPDHLQSRVNATGRMLSWGGGQPLGAVVGGVLASLLPIRVALLIMGVGVVTGLILALQSPLIGARRRIDPSPE